VRIFPVVEAGLDLAVGTSGHGTVGRVGTARAHLTNRGRSRLDETVVDLSEYGTAGRRGPCPIVGVLVDDELGAALPL